MLSAETEFSVEILMSSIQVVFECLRCVVSIVQWFNRAFAVYLRKLLTWVRICRELPAFT